MFFVWGWGAGASTVVTMSTGYVSQGHEGVESSSHNHCPIGVGPVDHCIMLFWSGGVKTDCESGGRKFGSVGGSGIDLSHSLVR